MMHEKGFKSTWEAFNFTIGDYDFSLHGSVENINVYCTHTKCRYMSQASVEQVFCLPWLHWNYMVRRTGTISEVLYSATMIMFLYNSPLRNRIYVPLPPLMAFPYLDLIYLRLLMFPEYLCAVTKIRENRLFWQVNSIRFVENILHCNIHRQCVTHTFLHSQL